MALNAIQKQALKIALDGRYTQPIASQIANSDEVAIAFIKSVHDLLDSDFRAMAPKMAILKAALK